MVPHAEASDVSLVKQPEEELTQAKTGTARQESDNKRRIKREHQTDAQDDDEVTVVETRVRKRPRADPEVIVLD